MVPMYRIVVAFLNKVDEGVATTLPTNSSQWATLKGDLHTEAHLLKAVAIWLHHFKVKTGLLINTQTLLIRPRAVPPWRIRCQALRIWVKLCQCPQLSNMEGIHSNIWQHLKYTTLLLLITLSILSTLAAKARTSRSASNSISPISRQTNRQSPPKSSSVILLQVMGSGTQSAPSGALHHLTRLSSYSLFQSSNHSPLGLQK